MNDGLLLTGGAVLLIMYFLYWPLVFWLTDTILENQRINKWLRIPLALANMSIIMWVSALKGGGTNSHLVLFVLLTLNFCIIYKDDFVKILFCSSACVLHVMVLRAFVTGVFAALLEVSVYAVSKDPTLFVLSGCVVGIITNLAIVMVLKFIPSDKIRIINQHKEQQWFLIAWMSVFNVYLLFNSEVFWEETYHPNIVGNEIIVSVAILLGLYIVVFFAFKTISLLGYKEKSAELQREIYQEQQFRSATIKAAIMTYEVNLTQDRVLKGFELGEATLGEQARCYSDMIVFMAHLHVHPDDIERVTQYGSRASLTREFENGKGESTIEYRRITDDGKYIWVRGVTNLTQSAENGDLLAFVFVKNIEAEKQRQLNLQYKAERDPLTGLYNKEMTGKLVNKSLMLQAVQSDSAFFMIDADNFKEVNDRLGHIYGDAVLCELAEKLQRVFRANDIVGRIGGDEFAVFMKEGATAETVKAKAAEICKALYTVFTDENKTSFTVSGSVGIAVSPKDGKSFAELYRGADIALYEAKRDGKNTFAVYSGNSFEGYQSKRNEIPQVGSSSPKSFRQNRIEYIFKILYQADSPVAAIHSALELIASHFLFERGYIFEANKDGKTASSILEWCAEGVDSHMDMMQNVTIDTLIPELEFERFHEEQILVMRTPEDASPAFRQFLQPLGINSTIQFGMFDHGRLMGTIGFDNCKNGAIPSDAEIGEMKTICNILAIFLGKHRIAEDAARTLGALTSGENYFENYIYVIDPETFKVLFMNEKMRDLMYDSDSSAPCYSFFRGNSSQCPDCPLKAIAEDPQHRTAIELYNEKLGMQMEASFAYLRWIDGSSACMISCMDITGQDAEKLLLSEVGVAEAAVPVA